MMWLFFSCLVHSDQEFAVLKQGGESVCERFPEAQNCQPEGEEFEPIPNDDDPEDFPPEDTSCNSAMRIRKVIPLVDSVVPVNVKPIVLTIGNGDDTHMIVDLKNNGQSVPHEQEVTCYIHEGDEEYHCTYLITPLQDLDEAVDGVWIDRVNNLQEKSYAVVRGTVGLWPDTVNVLGNGYRSGVRAPMVLGLGADDVPILHNISNENCIVNEHVLGSGEAIVLRGSEIEIQYDTDRSIVLKAFGE